MIVMLLIGDICCSTSFCPSRQKDQMNFHFAAAISMSHLVCRKFISASQDLRKSLIPSGVLTYIELLPMYLPDVPGLTQYTSKTLSHLIDHRCANIALELVQIIFDFPKLLEAVGKACHHSADIPSQ
ncbi:unnamed protein product [Albugo candida]|uniref:Uncharacterized protein n=1 Tax=Albugo candida TaxID=65357 RepID=A0A024GJC8_9STRA|nr:unnamed protein product [Albugo candida]|eukprot:CCI46826.1 unnamed protein product [Albugo candida]